MEEMEMIRSWYSDLTAEQIAIKHKIGRRHLLSMWFKLKQKGLLPKKGDRPRSKMSHSNNHDDDDALVHTQHIRVPENDPLLELLKKRGHQYLELTDDFK